MYIISMRGAGLAARLNRVCNNTHIGHVAILTSVQTIIGAFPKTGVKEFPFSPEDACGIDFFKVSGLSLCEWERAYSFARQQINKRYNLIGEISIPFTRIDFDPKRESYFSSQLVYESLESAGLSLFSRLSSNRVTTQHIFNSPELISTKLCPQFR